MGLKKKLQIWRADCKVIFDFWLHRGMATPVSVLFSGQFYIQFSFVNYTLKKPKEQKGRVQTKRLSCEVNNNSESSWPVLEK